jgi:hypothetical protein
MSTMTRSASSRSPRCCWGMSRPEGVRGWLGIGALESFERFGHGPRAGEDAERMSDRSRTIAELAQASLEGSPLLLGGCGSVGGLPREP